MSHHDLRNHLTIALANVEAMADGRLEVTPQRLDSVLQSLRMVAGLIAKLPDEALDATSDATADREP